MLGNFSRGAHCLLAALKGWKQIETKPARKRDNFNKEQVKGGDVWADCAKQDKADEIRNCQHENGFKRKSPREI